MGEKRILVVDDEPDTIAYMVALLEDHAYQVVTAPNTEKALVLFDQEPPDLIIVDVMMPGASGLDFIHQIRRSPISYELPIIVISGMGEILHDRCQSYLERYGVRPPDEILEKPFNPDDLLKMIELFLKNAN